MHISTSRKSRFLLIFHEITSFERISGDVQKTAISDTLEVDIQIDLEMRLSIQIRWDRSMIELRMHISEIWIQIKIWRPVEHSSGAHVVFQPRNPGNPRIAGVLLNIQYLIANDGLLSLWDFSFNVAASSCFDMRWFRPIEPNINDF